MIVKKTTDGKYNRESFDELLKAIDDDDYDAICEVVRIGKEEDISFFYDEFGDAGDYTSGFEDCAQYTSANSYAEDLYYSLQHLLDDTDRYLFSSNDIFVRDDDNMTGWTNDIYVLAEVAKTGWSKLVNYFEANDMFETLEAEDEMEEMEIKLEAFLEVDDVEKVQVIM